MALRVLVTDGMDAGAMEQLRKDGYEVIEQFYEPDQLGAALRDFDVVIIRSATKIKEPQIDAAAGSRLKLIIRAGVGVDNIAVKYAEEHGIQVKNTPRASSNAVAELALALLFSCARNISIAGHTMRENKWEKKAYSKGFELSGKTMGVIGYGRCDNGCEFADAAGIERSASGKGARTEVYYCHPYRPSERGSNENQNGLIRRHVPKGTDLSTISDEETKRIEAWLNNYPRKMFGYLCSEQLFREEMALILAS